MNQYEIVIDLISILLIYDLLDRWSVVMNYSVHAIMYSYFALRAAGNRLPKFFPMMLTSLQILQMIVGALVNWWALHYLSAGIHCKQTRLSIILNVIMYASYGVLFLQFFIKAYVFKSHSSIKAKTA